MGGATVAVVLTLDTAIAESRKEGAERVWQGPRIGFAAETGAHANIITLITILFFLSSLLLLVSLLSSFLSRPRRIPVYFSPSCRFVRAAVICSSWACMYALYSYYGGS